jgi:hypothetical protein
VDANHAGNKVTRRSHTGIIIFVQNAPIIWYSKEFIVAMHYKLRMFGVPIEGPANVFCDNRGVVKNTSMPESTLTKKHNAINYHAVREAAGSSGYFESWQGRWRNKFGRSIDKGDCWTEEMGFLLEFVLLNGLTVRLS